jgi:hypothetical protein
MVSAQFPARLRRHELVLRDPAYAGLHLHPITANKKFIIFSIATDVPEHVFITIVFHEMHHLEIRPVPLASGRMDMHPPQFREAGRRRSPNYQQSWEWLYSNLPQFGVTC